MRNSTIAFRVCFDGMLKTSIGATLYCVTLMATDKPLNRKEFESHRTDFLLAPQIQSVPTDEEQIGKCEENRSPACPAVRVKELLFCLLQKIWRLRRRRWVCLLSSAHAAHWQRIEMNQSAGRSRTHLIHLHPPRRQTKEPSSFRMPPLSLDNARQSVWRERGRANMDTMGSYFGPEFEGEVTYRPKLLKVTQDEKLIFNFWFGIED
jgi:hypothetical protein